MNQDHKQRYEHTIKQIISQLEHLMMEILHTSVKRLNADYDRIAMKSVTLEQPDDMKF